MSQKITVYMIGSIISPIVPNKDGVIVNSNGTKWSSNFYQSPTTIINPYVTNPVSYNYGVCYFTTSFSDITTGKYKLQISHNGFISSYPNSMNPNLQPSLPVNLNQPFQTIADSDIEVKGYFYIHRETDTSSSGNYTTYLTTDLVNPTSDSALGIVIPPTSSGPIEIAWEMGSGGKFLDNTYNVTGDSVLFPGNQLSSFIWSFSVGQLQKTALPTNFAGGSYCLSTTFDLIPIP